MSQDRTYYRLCETRQLVELARDSGNELAIALGERLEDKRGQSAELRELRDRLELAAGAAVVMRAEIAALEDEVRYLLGGNAAIEGE